MEVNVTLLLITHAFDNMIDIMPISWLNLNLTWLHKRHDKLLILSN